MRARPAALAASILVLATCGRQGAERGPPKYRDLAGSAAERAADLVARMTRAEKISQTMTAAPAIPRLGVPEYEWWNEALHGVARAGRATVFPQVIGLAATFDEKLVERVATAISDEARAKFNRAQARGDRGRYRGLTIFTPNVNIFRDPRWGRGQETFGEDPALTSRLGVAFIRGLQGDHPRYLKTAATAKHFAVHSGPEAERHGFDARPTPHDLADTYLPQFEACVRQGQVASVMAAYNRLGGEACAASPVLLDQILRAGWGFRGYVVGDCGAVEDILSGHRLVQTRAAAAAAALRAGTDLDCGRGFRALAAAIDEGLVTDGELDRAVTRLFTTRFRLGLFDPPELVPWAGYGPDRIESPQHLALALEAAARSIVLLENRGGVLPLGPAVRTLAVVGPTADNLPVLLANYHGTPSRPVTLLAGIRAAARERGIAVRYARGGRLTSTSAGALAEAVEAARASDVVIAAVGLDPRLEGEEQDSALNPSGDRVALGLPPGQGELLAAVAATGKPIVVVLTGGSAIAVPWAKANAAALLNVWYPGAEGGRAVAEVLFGIVNPSGRLPITIYRSAEDLPPFRDYSMRGRTYRYLDREPLYPFGFGRSYTTFRYSNAAATWPGHERPGQVRVDLENVGARAGDEVVQVYLLPKGAPTYAPKRWLAAFARVSLAAGERRTITLRFLPNALSLVDERGQRQALTYGQVAAAVGGRQPDRDGRYPNETEGLTTTLSSN